MSSKPRGDMSCLVGRCGNWSSGDFGKKEETFDLFLDVLGLFKHGRHHSLWPAKAQPDFA
jgi:hypothetical protein